MTTTTRRIFKQNFLHIAILYSWMNETTVWSINIWRLFYSDFFLKPIAVVSVIQRVEGFTWNIYEKSLQLESVKPTQTNADSTKNDCKEISLSTLRPFAMSILHAPSFSIVHLLHLFDYKSWQTNEDFLPLSLNSIREEMNFVEKFLFFFNSQRE